MHGTHQFFLSDKTTYLVLCNQRANEQPDEWLDMLKIRLGTHNKQSIGLVYTHCGSESNESLWSRKNTLQRKYGEFFDLEFFESNLHPNAKLNKGRKLKKYIVKRAQDQAVTKVLEAVFDLNEKIKDHNTHNF